MRVDRSLVISAPLVYNILCMPQLLIPYVRSQRIQDLLNHKLWVPVTETCSCIFLGASLSQLLGSHNKCREQSDEIPLVLPATSFVQLQIQLVSEGELLFLFYVFSHLLVSSLGTVSPSPALSLLVFPPNLLALVELFLLELGSLL